MSVRFDFYGILGGWILFSVGQYAWASPGYDWLVFPVALVVAILLMSQCCPVCSNPVSCSHGFWIPVAPRICTRCGHDLSKRGVAP
jgi:hypothetical protein